MHAHAVAHFHWSIHYKAELQSPKRLTGGGQVGEMQEFFILLFIQNWPTYGYSAYKNNSVQLSVYIKFVLEKSSKVEV